ncbi:hypothetical protein RN001_005219 [Aquatica leii]|uniref:NADH dehydrogenase [ubiquinone] 1 beta subcomplex subunit 2, mitochondrial n=1 Tax=Aquatica leii TaxID=1421715 RepID=A0AAN7Q6G5_9COLE|nr:hypothetical protein RN001_005219 [Aquatica leii]
MLVSRGLQLFKFSKAFSNSRLICTSGIQRSHAPWNYRCPPPPQPKYIHTLADGIAALMWWWVLWHLFTQYDHITGEFDYPDPSKWTDEELGIPCDDDQ